MSIEQTLIPRLALLRPEECEQRYELLCRLYCRNPWPGVGRPWVRLTHCSSTAITMVIQVRAKSKAASVLPCNVSPEDSRLLPHTCRDQAKSSWPYSQLCPGVTCTNDVHCTSDGVAPLPCCASLQYEVTHCRFPSMGILASRIVYVSFPSSSAATGLQVLCKQRHNWRTGP